MEIPYQAAWSSGASKEKEEKNVPDESLSDSSGWQLSDIKKPGGLQALRAGATRRQVSARLPAEEIRESFGQVKPGNGWPGLPFVISG